IHGPIGHAVDTFAVLGTIFGLSTSLGLGVIQINSGLNYLFGMPTGIGTQVILIVVITLVATASVFTGLDKGVRRLSELNMAMAVALLAFVLVAGPTVHLLQAFVQNTGNYISTIFSTTFNLYAYDPKPGWFGGWTLFYWGWWIAWSPFVGLFIARISRGRTIREFVVGVLMVPTGFTFLWMTIYGNTALDMVMARGITHLMETVSADSSVALFEFLGNLPLSWITSLVATLLVMIFFVTSADSGALVIDMLSSEGEEESPVWQRIFWALLTGALAISLLIAGGLTSLQAATIAAALPFTVVMIMMCWGLARALGMDLARQNILRQARVQSFGGGDWRLRLRALTQQSHRREVMQFIAAKARAALDEVAAELRKRGLEVTVAPGEDGSVALSVGHGAEIDFVYELRPQPYQPPTFMLDDPRRRRAQDDMSWRAEVFLREGGQDYDVMGWSHDDLIHDVLDQYQRHMHFLDNIR
ncbi:MAG: BCCT family transporter, partial [Burkholderiaceae bacterium]|nr:BCCT family transporter [Burkholderiaceae bacterium]